MRVLVLGFAIMAAPATAQLPSSGAISSTVNGALDVRADRPELSAPNAASVARRGVDPLTTRADAFVRVRKGQRCAWGGREYAPVKRKEGWFCERPRALESEARLEP